MSCIASSFVGSVAALKATKVQVSFIPDRARCTPLARRLDGQSPETDRPGNATTRSTSQLAFFSHRGGLGQ